MDKYVTDNEHQHLEQKKMVQVRARGDQVAEGRAKTRSAVILEHRKVKSDTVSTVSHLFPMK